MKTSYALTFVTGAGLLFVARSAQEELDRATAHHDVAVEYHLSRSLDAASGEYSRVLELDPPVDPDPVRLAIVNRLAPRIFATDHEPFELKDVAAVIHPTAPLIAFHLLWEDDI